MRFPKPNTIPSESTIEQLSNHHILNLISPYGAWFFVPTKPEERDLGFDASLQGYKALIIQYKRLEPSAKSVAINHRQLRDLQQNFPPASNGYVFYGFSLLSRYDDLAALFSAGSGVTFGAVMLFVDVHALPPTATSLALNGTFDVGIRRQGSKAIHCYAKAECLFSLVRQFARCEIGLRAAEAEGRERVADRGRVPQPHLNILWARP